MNIQCKFETNLLHRQPEPKWFLFMLVVYILWQATVLAAFSSSVTCTYTALQLVPQLCSCFCNSFLFYNRNMERFWNFCDKNYIASVIITWTLPIDLCIYMEKKYGGNRFTPQTIVKKKYLSISSVEGTCSPVHKSH